MRWNKIGKIFDLDVNLGWNVSHTQMPTPVLLKDKIRVFYSTRDCLNKTSSSFFDVSREDPRKILYVHDQPILEPGKIGHFDDCGAMASSAVIHNNQIYLYYIGWNVRNTVPFHNSIGLAISDVDSCVFSRYSEGPILDRGIHNPLFCTTPFVTKKENYWQMFYASGFKWATYDDSLESFYNIKVASSKDGINWVTSPNFIFDLNSSKLEGAAVRPSIFNVKGENYMLYCKRSFTNYRGSDESSYRFGLALFDNSATNCWKRIDHLFELDSDSPSIFDSDMLCYPATISVNGCQYLFYNGNSFGVDGIGLAILRT